MIRLEGVTIRQGEFRLAPVDLQIASGQYAVLMGRSGTGKTTLAEILCGLRRPEAGRLWIHHVEHTESPPANRHIGYVPQAGVVFPSMPVARQLAFALQVRRAPREVIRQRVDELARWLEIEHLLDRRPRDLSGGERQRVALGRALSFRPALLCLDEPTSHLDSTSRENLMVVLERLKAELKTTVLHITHSSQEARRLADCVYVTERDETDAAMRTYRILSGDAKG